MKVGVIGCGGMGAALVRGLGRTHEVTIFDRNPEKMAALSSGVPTPRTAMSIADACVGAEVVIVAVKPHATVAVIETVGHAAPTSCLIASVAAGVSIRALSEAAPAHAILRAMPNVGAAFGASTTGIMLGGAQTGADDDVVSRAESVFRAVGKPVWLAREDDFHAVTALGGSGPAFFLAAAEAMVGAASALGVSDTLATEFVLGALDAAARATIEGGAAPAAVRAAITSPNGTTAAGLAVLAGRDISSSFADAVVAAAARSRTLADG